MPNFETLGKLRGIARGLESLTASRREMGLAKEKLKMEKEQHDMDLKIKGLQLEKAKQSIDPEIFEAKKRALKYQEQIMKNAFNMENEEIDVKDRDLKGKATSLTAMGGGYMSKISEDYDLDPNSLLKGELKFITKKLTPEQKYKRDLQTLSPEEISMKYPKRSLEPAYGIREPLPEEEAAFENMIPAAGVAGGGDVIPTPGEEAEGVLPSKEDLGAGRFAQAGQEKRRRLEDAGYEPSFKEFKKKKLSKDFKETVEYKRLYERAVYELKKENKLLCDSSIEEIIRQLKEQ